MSKAPHPWGPEWTDFRDSIDRFREALLVECKPLLDAITRMLPRRRER